MSQSNFSLKSFGCAIEALKDLSADPKSEPHVDTLSGLSKLIPEIASPRDLLRLGRRSASPELMTQITRARGPMFDADMLPTCPPSRRPDLGKGVENTLQHLSRAVCALPEDHPARRNFLDAALGLLSQVTDIGQAFAAIIKTRNQELVASLLNEHQGQDWHRLVRPHVSIGTLAAERRLDLISLLHRAGVEISSDIHHMVAAAIRDDDPEVISFLRRDCRYVEPIWKQGRFAGELSMCGPGLAPFMYEELLSHLDNPHGRAMSNFWPAGAQYARWKQISALLASGRDVTRHFRGRTKLPDQIRILVDRTASRHGQLSLRSLEPDPVAVIGRDSRSVFYGLGAEAVESMMRAP